MKSAPPTSTVICQHQSWVFAMEQLRLTSLTFSVQPPKTCPLNGMVWLYLGIQLLRASCIFGLLGSTCARKLSRLSHLGYFITSCHQQYIRTSAANRLIGEVVHSQRRPLLGPSPPFTFKTLLRHYNKRAFTPRSLNVKLGPSRGLLRDCKIGCGTDGSICGTRGN